MSTASAIIVLGSTNTDLVVRSPRLPRPGETILGGEFYQAAGGKGANQAIAAARAATAPVTFVAALGNDAFGNSALAGFQQENLDARYVRVISGAHSGVALILVDERGENMISVASGANWLLAPEDIDRVPDEVFASAQVFLTSLETPLPTVLHGLRRARQHGLVTILNPAPADRAIVDSQALELVDVLTPNEHEAAALTGVELSNNDAVLAAARVLQSLGTKKVIVTLGDRGSVVVEERAHWIDAERVEAVDATAAGDAFNGALAARLAEGSSLASAAQWAGCAAALAVTRRGAQPSLPHRREIDDFAARRTDR